MTVLVVMNRVYSLCKNGLEKSALLPGRNLNVTFGRRLRTDRTRWTGGILTCLVRNGWRSR